MTTEIVRIAQDVDDKRSKSFVEASIALARWVLRLKHMTETDRLAMMRQELDGFTEPVMEETTVAR